MRVLDVVNFEAAEVAPRTPATGDHCVVLIDDAEDAALAACPFIADGLRAGERVLSWLPPGVCDRIEQSLSREQLARLQLVDAATIYRTPFDAAALVARVVETARAEDSPLRIVGGPMGDPEAVAPLSEWRRYERLGHEACVSEGIAGLCVWERPSMSDECLAMVLRSHSLVHDHDAMRRNPDFVWVP